MMLCAQTVGLYDDVDSSIELIYIFHVMQRKIHIIATRPQAVYKCVHHYKSASSHTLEKYNPVSRFCGVARSRIVSACVKDDTRPVQFLIPCTDVCVLHFAAAYHYQTPEVVVTLRNVTWLTSGQRVCQISVIWVNSRWFFTENADKPLKHVTEQLLDGFVFY